ncbi:uncharacterized protein F4822DRAFT_425739 [Hypoxylon trugodes]|uniref:uncharacterized protein n=1 Tax=Hypoxylon trugodes TaxID=326681 RepID=UPI00219128CB|nr:uncharacterized protein F4822DRAFT_425739 [Hypoxylon trugodes]KAI1392535.1 hypothetical protein F4822DRAFT_425739 [Hypoxylon trugodes]
MSKNIPRLHLLFFEGFNYGLRWETKPKDVALDDGGTVKKCHFLLQNPYAFHVAKVLFKGLRTARPPIVSIALADIYDFVTERIHLCRELEPREFFTRTKNCFDWSRKFSDEAFYARALFLDTAVVFAGIKTPKQPLTDAFDHFKDLFLEAYLIEHSKVLLEGVKVSPETIEQVNDEVSANLEVHEKYFPWDLTHPDALGDGQDKLIPWKQADQMPEEEVDFSALPDEELFFYDTKCKSKRSDAFLGAGPSKASVARKGKEPVKVGAVREYDAFRDYRDPAADGDNGGDEGVAGPSGPVGGEAGDDEPGEVSMGDAWVEDEVLRVKKLKIAEEKEEEEEEL